MTRAHPQAPRLSRKARAILAFIARAQAAHGAPPTRREIGARFGIRSTNGVQYYVDLLEQRGAIRRRPGRARGIALTPAARPGVRPGFAETVRLQRQPSWLRATRQPSIPILGRIAAGGPAFAAEETEGRLDLERLGRSLPDFALRVRGDSMRGAGILDGDLVLVRRDPTPRNGEIVVAMIGDETTVKRFFREKRRIVLQPENPAFEPIAVTETSPELQILGRVVGVFREIG